MEPITYSLREGNHNSDQYYKDVSAFTDEVLKEAGELTGHLVQEFQEYIWVTGREKLRTQEEYTLELLLLGVFWKVYSGDAFGLAEISRHILIELAELRKKQGYLKPGIDFLRGILSTLFLSPDLYDHEEYLEPTIDHMEQLLAWLAATGDFKQEVKRLRLWKEYFNSLPSYKVSDHIATCITFAAWFEVRSEEVLGKYTANVNRYLNEIRPSHYWCEDVIFCGRRRVEYHLNMVGAEIMNRAFRRGFVRSEKKVVFLPGCMRILPENLCKAEKAHTGFQCIGCTEACRVRQLKELGKRCNFEAWIIPHESNISSVEASDSIANKKLGVVGISCVLNLIAGGLMLKDMGIPAQCVLLDYSGCKNHWHPKGISTEINVKKLLKIIEES